MPGEVTPSPAISLSTKPGDILQGQLVCLFDELQMPSQPCSSMLFSPRANHVSLV